MCDGSAKERGDYSMQVKEQEASVSEIPRRDDPAKVRCRPIGWDLLPRKFPLAQLQRLYEAVLGKKLDPGKFRRRILKTGLVEEAAPTSKAVARGAARLYRCNKATYQRLAKQGCAIEF